MNYLLNAKKKPKLKLYSSKLKNLNTRKLFHISNILLVRSEYWSKDIEFDVLKNHVEWGTFYYFAQITNCVKSGILLIKIGQKGTVYVMSM